MQLKKPFILLIILRRWPKVSSLRNKEKTETPKTDGSEILGLATSSQALWKADTGLGHTLRPRGFPTHFLALAFITRSTALLGGPQRQLWAPAWTDAEAILPGPPL